MMIISKPIISHRKSYSEYAAWVIPERFPYLPKRVWWRFAPEYRDFISHTGTPLLAAFLLPSMAKESRLVIKAPVSPKLLAVIPQIQKIYSSWFKYTREIEVIATPSQAEPSTAHAVGCFFSGGVDSFYSLLKNALPSNKSRPITHLIFSAGFDIKLKKKSLLRRVRSHMQQVADQSNKRFVSVSTNLKYFGDHYVPWIDFCGAFLSSIGLILEPFLHKVIIPSTYSWENMRQIGSHPELDVLWSTEKTTFMHDGCEANRAEKIINHIAKSELALTHLRVCWRTRNVTYNCGVCEKCLRTMIPLYAGSGSTRFPTFPIELDPDNVRAIQFKESSIDFGEENFKALDSHCSEWDQKLKQAIREAIEHYYKNKIID